MESPSVLSPSGRTARTAFALGAVIIYVLIFASQALLSAPVMTRSGVAPFALVQAAITCAWYVLHARRLHDAGRGTGSTLAIAILYGLGVILFALLVLFVGGTGPDGQSEPNNFAGLLILAFIIALFNGDASIIGIFFYAVLVILIVIFLPLLIALGYSIWAGTLRSAGPAAALP